MYLDVSSERPQIHGVALFSEPSPTSDLFKYRQFVVLSGYGNDYEEGIEDLRHQLRLPPNRWIWRILSPRSAEALR